MKKKINDETSKKNDILMAAERVFAEKGFRGTTVREVAKRAGIANSLIFYYFKNKTVMYEAVFKNVFDQLENLIQQSLDLELDRLTQLKKIIFSVIDLGTMHRNLLKILIREIIDEGSVLKKITKKYFMPLFELSSEFFAKGKEEAFFRDVDPLHFLQSMMGMIAFYFITDPLFQAAGVEDPYGPQEIEKRKHEVWEVIRSSLI